MKNKNIKFNNLTASKLLNWEFPEEEILNSKQRIYKLNLNDSSFKTNHKFISKKHFIKDKKNLFKKNSYKSYSNIDLINDNKVYRYSYSNENESLNDKKKFSNLEKKGVFRENNSTVIYIDKASKEYTIKIVILNMDYLQSMYSFRDKKNIDIQYNLSGLGVLLSGPDISYFYKANSLEDANLIMNSVSLSNYNYYEYSYLSKNILNLENSKNILFLNIDNCICEYEPIIIKEHCKSTVKILNEGTQYFYNKKILRAKGGKVIIGNQILKPYKKETYYQVKKDINIHKEKIFSKKHIEDELNKYLFSSTYNIEDELNFNYFEDDFNLDYYYFD